MRLERGGKMERLPSSEVLIRMPIFKISKTFCYAIFYFIMSSSDKIPTVPMYEILQK